MYLVLPLGRDPAPYDLRNIQIISCFQDLATNLGKELKIKKEDVLERLKNLQLKALQNVDERNKFQATGLATLKLKLPKSCDDPSVQIYLLERGEALRKQISEKLEIPAER